MSAERDARGEGPEDARSAASDDALAGLAPGSWLAAARRRGGGVDRGVSFPLSHALTLVITTTLVAGLVVSAGGLLAAERARTTDRELAAIGVGIASDLAAVDRLVDGGNATVSLDVSYPRRVVGGGYLVSLSAPGGCAPDGRPVACLSLVAPATDVERTVPFRNETPVANGSATGGVLEIAYRDGALTIADRP